MNILFVIHTPKDPLTAVYANVSRRARYFAECGHHSAVLTPNDFPWLERLSPRWYPLLYPLAVAFWLMKQSRKYDVVILHSYAGWTLNLLRRVLPQLKRIRTITSFHGLEPLHYRIQKEDMEKAGQPLSLRYRLMQGMITQRLIRQSCRRSDLIGCLNGQEVAYLVENEWARPAKVVISANGVDRSFFAARLPRKEAKNLLFVGQWMERKGIKYLIEAFSRLACTKPDLQLWCIGTLLDEQTVLADFPDKVRARVIVRPKISREEISKIYQESDVFVFPSLFEGSSLALLEAMASGLPIVTTPVGAAPDMLESEASALLVPARDSLALAEAVQRLLVDGSLRERLGRQAQAVAERYEGSRLYQGQVRIVEELVNGDNAPGPVRKLMKWS